LCALRMWPHVLRLYNDVPGLAVEFLHWEMNQLWHYRTANVAALIVLKMMCRQGTQKALPKLREAIASLVAETDRSDVDWPTLLKDTSSMSIAAALDVFGGRRQQLCVFFADSGIRSAIATRVQRGGQRMPSPLQHYRVDAAWQQQLVEDYARTRTARERVAAKVKRTLALYKGLLNDDQRQRYNADRVALSLALLSDTAETMQDATREDVRLAFDECVSEHNASQLRPTVQLPLFLLSYSHLDRVVGIEIMQKHGLPASQHELGTAARVLAVGEARRLIEQERRGEVVLATKSDVEQHLKAHLRANDIDPDVVTDVIRTITLRSEGRRDIYDWYHRKHDTSDTSYDWQQRRLKKAERIATEQAEKAAAEAAAAAATAERVERAERRLHGLPPLKRSSQHINANVNDDDDDEPVKPKRKKRGRQNANPWSEAEDDLLFASIYKYGRNAWPALVKAFANNVPKRGFQSVKARVRQLRTVRNISDEDWQALLSPQRTDIWSDAEDAQLAALVEQHGDDWTQIAALFDTERSAKAVQCRWLVSKAQQQ
jgi:hypothetical protein